MLGEAGYMTNWPKQALDKMIELVKDVEPEIEAHVRKAADVMADLGAEVFEVNVPGAEFANQICSLITKADALALHRERYQNHPELMGNDTLRRLKSGNAGSSTAEVKNGSELIHNSPLPSRRCRVISREASCNVASAAETFAR